MKEAQLSTEIRKSAEMDKIHIHIKHNLFQELITICFINSKSYI